MILRILNA